MKTIRTCLALALTLLTVSAALLSCVDMANDPPGATLPPNSAQTTAVTTVDRSAITVPNLSAEKKELYQAIWAVYGDQVDEKLTINDIRLASDFIYRCGDAWICKYYGILSEDATLTQAPMTGEETVAGYTFTYGDTLRWSVFIAGKQYSLTLAHETGVLSKENIHEIWEALQK